MYNRYIRNDRGQYQRIAQEEPSWAAPHSPPTREEPPADGFLKKILGKLKLDGVDRGDILLLLLLLFLFSDGEDDELLIALAHLLIL